MDEGSDQILEDIETQRNQLGENLNELETRVRRTTDWRAQFDRNPMLMLGAALGGGLLIGAVVSGARSRSSGSYTSSRHFSGSSAAVSTSNSATSLQRHRASETIDHVKAALIAYATAKAKEFLNQALPGFENYLRDTESQPRRQGFSNTESAGSYDQRSEYTAGDSGPTPGSYGSGSYNQARNYGQQTSGSGQGANYGQNFGTDYGRPGAGERGYSSEREERQRY